jgi:hypothetical protein
MPRDDIMTVKIENAEIIFPNFSGKEGKYNQAGQRHFSVVLPQELADQMVEDGWNVRLLSPRDEGDPERPIIQVAVRFDIRPPRITMITSTARTVLDESTVEVLDYADIALVDLIIRSHSWEVNGKTGIKAYLQTMFVTIEEDDLERKYAVVDDDYHNE